MCIQAYSNTNGYLGTSSETGEGSGIIASSDGYIITNAHVIEGASALKVILSDGTSYEATVVGSDTATDLALIIIELPVYKLLNSVHLKIYRLENKDHCNR